MNILFLSGLFPQNRTSEIERNSRGAIQYAADLLQKSMIKGLDEYPSKLSILTLPFIGSFPFRFRKLFIKSEHFSHRDQSEDVQAGFCNLTLYKMRSRYLAARKHILAWCGSQVGKKLIIIYSVHSPFLLAARYAKKLCGLEICLIVPDLPQFMSGSRNIFYQALKAVDGLFITRAMRKVDSFVLLSKHMVEKLKIDGRPWIVVEGIYAGGVPPKRPKRKGEKTVVMYSGTLAKRYGIMTLLDAFQKIESPAYELWICGEGDARDLIEARAEADKRIMYYGQLPHHKVLDLQAEATLLVNPRTSEGEFTKYSFPSKIIEYFASGTPCLMYRLPGIPEEYYDYCFCPDDETPDGLYHKILAVCNLGPEELDRFGERARAFILTYKNPSYQCGKIYEMLDMKIPTTSGG